MNILKDPRELADELINCAVGNSMAARFVVFGDWCKMYGKDLPEIYVEAVAGYVLKPC